MPFPEAGPERLVEQQADVVTGQIVRLGHELDRLAVVTVEREGHLHALAVPAADIEAVRAPALVRLRHPHLAGVGAVPSSDLSRQREFVQPHHPPDPLAVVGSCTVGTTASVHQSVHPPHAVARPLSDHRHDVQEDFPIGAAPVEAARARLWPQIGRRARHVQSPAHRRGRMPGHRLDPLNKCGLFFTTSRAASRISMVIACLPTRRCRSRTCFSSSRILLIGTTSSPACIAAVLPRSSSFIQRRMMAGWMSSSRAIVARVVSPLRIPSTVVRLNSAVNTRRPSAFLAKSPMLYHLSWPYSRAERCLVETGGRPLRSEEHSSELQSH